MSDEKEKAEGALEPAPDAAKVADATAKTAAAEKPAKIPVGKNARPKNCQSCNKPLKKWYYKNMKYYCTKRCWKAATKKAQEKTEQPAA